MLVGIFGNMGSGKTLLMTILSKYAEKKTGYPVYANYPLKNSVLVTRFKELLEIENGILSMDELWVSMDSRQSDFNVNLSRFIMWTRKKNILLYFTSQLPSQVDKRVRHACDLWVGCEHLGKMVRPFFRYTFLNGLTGTILKAIKIPDSKAEKFYSEYDSFKVIEPIYANTNYKTKRDNKNSFNYKRAGSFPSY